MSASLLQRDPAGGPVAEPSQDDVVRRAAAQLHTGRAEGIAEALRPWVEAGGTDALVISALALALESRVEEAADAMVEIATRRPDALHPLCDLAPLLLDPAALARAEAVYHAVAARTPDEPRLWHAYSLYYTQAFRHEEAIAAARRSVGLDGGTPITTNQHGIALTAAGALEEGLEVFAESARRWPDSYAAFSNVACTEAALGRFEPALEAYRRAISLSPGMAQLRLNHAICLLKAGRMTQGWTEYEWRLQLPGHTELPIESLLPSLSETTRLDGRTVLVTHEEGLGDTLQFLRFIRPLSAHGARVVVAVPPALLGLAARVEGVAEAIDADHATLRYDWHCPFMSLPRALAATSGRNGAPVPYLRPDAALVARWSAYLPPPDTLRVGLVWAGASRTHLHWAVAVDRRRSVSLAQLAGLGRLGGVSLVSLQLGPPADQLFDPPDGMRIHDAMHETQSMDDTAALIAGLDVVVSVDTSVAHLAGGMGKPVLLLDRFDNCWRWGHGSETTTLYPQMRIFRQARPDDWSAPIAEMVEAVRELARTHKTARRTGRRPSRR